MVWLDIIALLLLPNPMYIIHQVFLTMVKPFYGVYSIANHVVTNCCKGSVVSPCQSCHEFGNFVFIILLTQLIWGGHKIEGVK
jgi:hypothetical protein